MSPLDNVRRGVHVPLALLNRIVRGVERRVRGGRLPAARAHDEQLHRLLGLEWPCAVRDEFDVLWPAVTASLREQGLVLGRGAYGGWDDADPALARVVWCLTRHLRPMAVVETGVARGLTSRVILEALARNDAGRLWSVDLPPSLTNAPGLADQTGIAVPAELRERWTLLRGASRDCLPGLIGGLARLNLPVDLFVHDSLHTGRNVRFELDCVWPALAAGGLVVIDDIEQNAAFRAYARAHPQAHALVCDADDGRAQFGCLQHVCSV
jgi:predicted O-methyltransferase YrrM